MECLGGACAGCHQGHRLRDRGYKMKVVVTVGAFIRVVFLLGLLLALVILIAVGAISRTGYAALTDGSDVAVSYMV